jgi:conjugative transfer pilus assembly protein TraH
MNASSKKRGHRIGKLAVVTLCAWSLEFAPVAGAADISAQMQQMFVDMGSVGNVTGPGAWKSQTMSIYTGGEMQMRTPIRDYQLWSVALPSISAGCGGIDAYLGSFSHINSAEFKAMLQQIGANTVGLLFKAALKSINPLIESALGDLEKTILSVNNYSRSSCQLAQSLVNGVSGALDINANSACIEMAKALYGDDEPAAQMRCKTGAPAVNTDAKNSTDPAIQTLAQRDVNLVWSALSASSLDNDSKEMFLNIAGTILLYKPVNNGGGAGQTAQDVDPTIDSLAMLLNGNAPGSSANTVLINGWLTCPDADCMSPVKVNKEITPFTTWVRQTLQGLRDAMATRAAVPASTIAFVNMVSVPVYRMMAVGYMAASSEQDTYLTDLLIDRYATIIAYDYAHAFLTKGLKDMRVYLAAARTQNAIEDERAKRLVDRIDAMRTALDHERQAALQRVPQMNSVIDDIQNVERQLRLSLPQDVGNMISFSNLMTGHGG